MTAHTDPKNMRDDELIIVRTFDAPAALVFRIWADSDHMQQWMGPKDFTCTHLESDFRVGGKYRACIVSKQYGENWFGGEFKEIEQNKKITLVEKDGKTVQTFHQTPFASVEMRDSHIEGWNESFDKEQVYAEKLAREAV